MQHQYQDIKHAQISDDQIRKAQQRRAIRNRERALAFEEAMFNWRSRHLLLFLTFTYKSEFRPFIAFEDIQRDRDNFFNNVRFNQMLQGINGVIWKIEEGDQQGGLHMHLVIFYDGRHRADVHLAECIGEYWANVVTCGRGQYWNSNADKGKFKRRPWGDATGQIDRGDHVKRDALRTYLKQYIAKDSQHVSSRTNPHSRMFGTSYFPS